jgi:hypothetical protein
MPALITELITGQDGHEIITEAVSNLLAVEIAEQQVLAVNDGQDPDLWKAHVYRNRVKPFDEPVDGEDTTPIINVWFQNAAFNKDGSTVRANRGDGTWNIDIYGFGKSKDTPTGHTPGDETAKDQVDRWLGLVRRILMSAQYTYLGSPRANDGVNPSTYQQYCWGRWVDGITAFQPELETRAAVTTVGSRLALGVHYLVDSPQFKGEVFDILATSVFREEDGRLLVEVHTDISGTP